MWRRQRRSGSVLWRRLVRSRPAAMCLAGALMVCMSWWLWLRGGGGAEVKGRGLDSGAVPPYDEVRMATDRSLLRLSRSEKDAREAMSAHSSLDRASSSQRPGELEGMAANWASILKEARVELSRHQTSANAEMRRMQIALEESEVARRRSAAKLLALKSGVDVPEKQRQKQESPRQRKDHATDKKTAAATVASSLLSATSAAAAAATTYDEFKASNLPPLRIYIYDLPSKFNADLSRDHPDCKWDSAYTWETKYTLEVYLHEMLLKSELRTLDPEEADLFYVPVYVGCFLHSHGTNFIKTQEHIRDSQQWVQTNYPYWGRSQGRDHVFTLTHDIGACIAPFQELRHAILITNTGELMNRKEAFSVYTNMYTRGYAGAHDLSLPCYSPWKDIVAPPMINDKYMLEWHNTRKGREETPRNLLATFRGTIIDKPGWKHYSRGIRQNWLRKYEFNDEIKITPVHPREGFGTKAATYQANYRRDFTSSKFCLCPPGWATWTPRLFEALLLGCIPVLVADHNLLPFSRTVDYTKFAVHISEDNANDLKAHLPQSDARIKELQDGVSAIWPAFVYNDPPKPGDAFYHIISELFWKSRSVQRGQRWGRQQ